MCACIYNEKSPLEFSELRVQRSDAPEREKEPSQNPRESDAQPTEEEFVWWYLLGAPGPAHAPPGPGYREQWTIQTKTVESRKIQKNPEFRTRRGSSDAVDLGLLVVNTELPLSLFVHRVSSSLLGPADPSFCALSGHLKVTARCHEFNNDFLSLSCEQAPRMLRLLVRILFII